MQSASDRAYHEIRKHLIAGRFRPGMRLSEAELCDLCGVSRTPIRDALRRLEAEFFIAIEPNRGATVVDWGRGDFAEIFEMRALLEGLAARKAAINATPEQIERLSLICAEVDLLLDQKPANYIETFLSLNAQFHGLICQASGSLRLQDMISKLVDQAIVVRTAVQYSFADLIRSNRYHFDIVEAISRKNALLAEQLMAAHLLVALEVYREGYLPPND